MLTPPLAAVLALFVRASLAAPPVARGDVNVVGGGEEARNGAEAGRGLDNGRERSENGPNPVESLGKNLSILSSQHPWPSLIAG